MGAGDPRDRIVQAGHNNISRSIVPYPKQGRIDPPRGELTTCSIILMQSLGKPPASMIMATICKPPD